MKDLVKNIDKKNLWIIAGIGVLFFIIYTVLLWFRPQESWIDETYFADWARNLAEHNRYYTICGEPGRPTHFPLYVFVLALWLKVVGFGYFAVHFPNMCFALATYWVLSLVIVGRKHITSRKGVVGFSLLYWLAPAFYWIINCGRTEVLCLLIGVLTSYNFVQAIESGLLRHKLLLLLYSFLLMAAGVEGVIFATLFIFIYSIFHYRDAWKHKVLYVWHFGGYLISLIAMSILTWRLHCLHQFYDKMFGYSKTFSTLYLYIRAWVKNTKHGEIVVNTQNLSQPKSSFLQSLMDALTMNTDYVILMGVIIILLFVLCCQKQFKKINKSTWIMISVATVAPIIYVLAGRFPLYYTWAAYIPCAIATIMLTESVKTKWCGLGGGVLMTIFFSISSGPEMVNNILCAREKDRQNREEIKCAQIDPNKGTCIPYSWYYYIVDENENIWFQTSRDRIEDIDVIVYNPEDYNEESFMNMFTLREQSKIGSKIVYEVVRDEEIEGKGE